ncbi:methylenetetrahydrofolate reductase [NAD(P)H] [Sphingomicrobium sediminis]|uniref:Methylenetetrahydrofolate reductase n=1 Tax=Sphingomicrobium sediminis TaxID=2950949 RepID=A0A9X2J3P5_9SPHN|nr:methylenetetrahydrofolate reductase [NAD(P)H] [Sphingomicrobium sediminis]MCM8557516.1 methylenetetrahydrofolate reductase [NAD(P)H] [Sphingomicrobium sediminis]
MSEIQPHAPAPLFAGPKGDIDVSFEFFPPKTEKMSEKLWSSIERLEPLGPRFVSVTYGAGGSTRERTHETVKRIVEETSLTPAAHLTCVDATREEVQEVAREYWDAGVRHIVALRGDPPGEGQCFAPHPGGYANAAELVAGLKEVADFDISVAAYPECHPEALSFEADLDHLLRKIDAGASRAISQFFFDPEPFFRLRDALAARGREIELVPGILPVSNVAQTRKFAGMCGAEIPEWMAERFEGLDDTPQARELVAATIAAELCGQLYAGGVRHFHFYTLNRANLSYAICRLLGVKPQ